MAEYINSEYKGSIAYNTVMSATIEQLRCARNSYINAISFHEKEGNNGQVKFFTDGLTLVDRRISKLNTETSK